MAFRHRAQGLSAQPLDRCPDAGGFGREHGDEEAGDEPTSLMPGSSDSA